MATVVYCGIWIAKIYKNIIIQKAPDINKRASSEAATGRIFWYKIRKGERTPMPLGATGDNTKSPRHL